MVRELATWVEGVTAAAPLVLVLEDLHWSDRATLDVLVALAHGRAPARFLLLATYRPIDAIIADHPLPAIKQELVRKRVCRDLPLSALAGADVHAYLTARYGAPPSPPSSSPSCTIAPRGIPSSWPASPIISSARACWRGPEARGGWRTPPSSRRSASPRRCGR